MYKRDVCNSVILYFYIGVQGGMTDMIAGVISSYSTDFQGLLISCSILMSNLIFLYFTLPETLLNRFPNNPNNPNTPNNHENQEELLKNSLNNPLLYPDEEGLEYGVEHTCTCASTCQEMVLNQIYHPIQEFLRYPHLRCVS